MGAVGYTLGGGLPVMCRTFGFAADRMLGAELVTADGVQHRVDAAHEPELLWALCGGKGNLGVVTGMTIGLVPVSTINGGGIFYAAEDIPAVLHAYLDWAATMPEQTSTSLAILRLPPAPQLPEPIRGRTVAHLRVCHVGDPADGERILAPCAPSRRGCWTPCRRCPTPRSTESMPTPIIPCRSASEAR